MRKVKNKARCVHLASLLVVGRLLAKEVGLAKLNAYEYTRNSSMLFC